MIDLCTVYVGMVAFVAGSVSTILALPLLITLCKRIVPMAAIDNLNSAVTRLGTAAGAAVNKIGSAPNNDAAIQAAADQIGTIAKSLEEAVNPTPATMQSILPPASVPRRITNT